MSINVKEIQNKQEWDGFVTAQTEYTFLQSWAWGEFNAATGDKVFRLGIYKQQETSNKRQELVAVTMVIKVHARRGNFLFVPHGPIIKQQATSNKQQVLNTITQHLKNLAKEEGDIVFLRISPLLKESEENTKIFKELGFKDAPIYMHAETTWTLDLDAEEKDLMAGMRKNTRNLVRRAERDGVVVESGTSEEFIEEFYNLYEGTAQAQGFVPFSKKYIGAEIGAFKGNAKIYLAKWEGKTLSTALIPHYGNSAFYHHGANSTEHRKIPAAYLLQWQAILDAKEQGRAHYNFWGIAKDDENKKHPWYGLSFFKKGFGGYRTDYVHAQDMPLSRKYMINYAVEKIRLMKRGV